MRAGRMGQGPSICCGRWSGSGCLLRGEYDPKGGEDRVTLEGVFLGTVSLNLVSPTATVTGRKKRIFGTFIYPMLARRPKATHPVPSTPLAFTQAIRKRH